MSDDEEPELYSVKIKTNTSPAELKAFTDILESHGYTVVTDLNRGELKIRGDQGDRVPPGFNEMDSPELENDQTMVRGKLIESEYTR